MWRDGAGGDVRGTHVPRGAAARSGRDDVRRDVDQRRVHSVTDIAPGRVLTESYH